MKNLLLTICLIISTIGVSAEINSESLVPEIEGYTKVSVKSITPENFSSYLKMKSELFNDYGLKEIALANYEKQGQKIKIEIFKVENSDLGFGLYAQDLSTQLQYFEKIGSQGYYMPQGLNFYKDCYYVKLHGENVENDEVLLKNIAKKIAGKIPGEANLPLVLTRFPNYSKILGTDRFVAKNFIGYPMFKNVFAADYYAANGPVTYFSFSSDENKAVLTEYYKSINVAAPKFINGEYSVEDPIFGRINFVIKDNVVKGLMGPFDSASRAEFFNYDYDAFLKQVNSAGNIASNKKAFSSSNESGFYRPDNAFDNDFSTRWSSQFRDTQWIAVDLENEIKIKRVLLIWEGAYGEWYQVQTSKDNKNWSTVYEIKNSDGRMDDITFSPVSARYVRLNLIRRHTPYGFSLFEFSVFKE